MPLRENGKKIANYLLKKSQLFKLMSSVKTVRQKLKEKKQNK